MEDTIRCPRCSKDIEDIVYIEHRNAHKAGYQPPKVTPVVTGPKPFDPEGYIPPYARGTVSMDNGQPPSYNTHMVQVQPRNNKRPAVLDAAIERERKKPRERPSGHSLIR